MKHPPNRTFSRRGVIVVLALIILAALATYVMSGPRLVPGQEPLTDIQSIETLRVQFNQDAGKTRLLLLLSPT